MKEKSPPGDIQNFLDFNERLQGEQVLGVIPSGPASTLIVTNRRIIGKTQEKNTKIFQGSLEYEDILTLDFSPGNPVFGAPSLSLEYRTAGDNTRRVTFHFPGRLFGRLLTRLAGYDPREIYLLIQKQVKKTKDSATTS